MEKSKLAPYLGDKPNKISSLPVAEIFKDPICNELNLKLIAGFQGTNRKIYTADINRPGLALTGYLEYFANDRIQVMGNTEINYLRKLTSSNVEARLVSIFSFEVPAFLLSRGLEPPQVFLDVCNRHGVPVIQSTLSTDQVISRVILYLAEKFSPKATIHGTAVDCFGVGVLLVGKSGVGKSETALELVERGHRLVGDDVIVLKKAIEEAIIMEPNPEFEHYMHIRGIGMVDVFAVYGAGHIRRKKELGLIVELVETKRRGAIDNLDELLKGWPNENLLDVKIPFLRIPVGPGRNTAVIVESAALKCRLKELGIDIDKVFAEKSIGRMLNNS
ncbi:MAG: HPr(Ser) kinase/phosphatase [Candidatus Hydrogenedentes bacterium]|nr:HPr(Ser) kinase/phosphatase [Candidatus Hydrogenedentota bacterium]